jgi:hypothetical protein
MNKIILFLCLLYASGCAYKGVVYINSPTGEGNVIEKDFNSDLKASLK